MIDLTQFKTWAEAERWLSRHGYGVGDIADLKRSWVEPKTDTPVIVESVKEPALKASVITNTAPNKSLNILNKDLKS